MPMEGQSSAIMCGPFTSSKLFMVHPHILYIISYSNQQMCKTYYTPSTSPHVTHTMLSVLLSQALECSGLVAFGHSEQQWAPCWHLASALLMTARAHGLCHIIVLLLPHLVPTMSQLPVQNNHGEHPSPSSYTTMTKINIACVTRWSLIVNTS